MSEASPADANAAGDLSKERWFGNVKGDLFGGLTAGIVALPLALGFGVASGIDSLSIDGVPINGALAGMIGAIVVGIMAAAFGGTPSQISGPTGPLTVVAAGMVSEITGDPRWVFAAIALSGAFQIAFGLLRIGKYINYIPYPVISGFMSGIGVIIVILQIPQIMGAPAVGNPVAAVMGVPDYLGRLNLLALVLGLATIAIIYATPRITKAVPGTLVGLVIVTVASVLIQLGINSSQGLTWQEPVLCNEFVGPADVITINRMNLGEEEIGLSFLVTEGTASLEGRVRDAAGAPLPGVTVTAPALNAEVQSQTDGSFQHTSTPLRLSAGDGLDVTPGDVVQWQGKRWVLLHDAHPEKGVPFPGPRLLVTTRTTPLSPFHDKAGSVLTFDGDSLDPHVQPATAGWTVLVAGDDGHKENHCFVYDEADGGHWLQTSNIHVPQIGEIPSGLPSVSLPREMDWTQLWLILPVALMLAALASIDSLLTSLVADAITKTRHDSERELIGQGLGNLIAGCLGGLPGAGATMRTVINVRSGGRGPLSGVTHGLFLIAILAGLGPLAERIPHSVLAGILITVGIGIVDYKGLRHLFKIPRGDAAVMLAVLVLTVFVDLMTAVAVGMMMASILLVKRLSDMDPATHSPLKDIASHLPWMPNLEVPAQVADGIFVVEIHGSLFFGNSGPLQRQLGQLGHADAVVLEMGDVRFVDQSGVYAFTDLIQDLQREGTFVYLAHLQPEPLEMFTKLHVIPSIVPKSHVFEQAKEAVEVAVKAVAEEKGHSVRETRGLLKVSDTPELAQPRATNGAAAPAAADAPSDDPPPA